MNYRGFVAGVCCILSLASCATRTYWYNNNRSANWDSDLYECTKAHSTTITSGGGTGLVGTLNAAEVGSVRTDYAMRDLCLKSRGWYQSSARVSQAPTPAPASQQPTYKTKDACPWGFYWNSSNGRCEKVGG